MPKFKNLDAIDIYLQNKIWDILWRSGDIERVLAEAMADAAWRYVYDAYEPKYYNRREDDGGLADTRNMQVTDVRVVDGKVRLIFENTTKGNDNLRHTYLTDTIEEGIKENWAYQGVWSDARPFVAETVKKLNEDPSDLIDALKKGLKAKGFVVK